MINMKSRNSKTKIVWKNQTLSVCSNCGTIGTCWYDDINGCYRSLCCGRVANDPFIEMI